MFYINELPSSILPDWRRQGKRVGLKFGALGLRVTVPRLRVLEVMQANQGHWLSVEDIAKALADNGGIGIGLIYRALSDLNAGGVLLRDVRDGMNGGKAVYSVSPVVDGADRERVVSITCRECGAVVFLHDNSTRALLEQLFQKADLLAAQSPISIHMECAACRERPLLRAAAFR